jgi:hypothetical protein
MKTKKLLPFFVWIFFTFEIALSESVRRGRRALYSKPSGDEEIKRVVRIETFYSADRVTDVDFCTGVLLNETIGKTYSITNNRAIFSPDCR